jgi:hypothetical protein
LDLHGIISRELTISSPLFFGGGGPLAHQRKLVAVK